MNRKDIDTRSIIPNFLSFARKDEAILITAGELKDFGKEILAEARIINNTLRKNIRKAERKLKLSRL